MRHSEQESRVCSRTGSELGRRMSAFTMDEILQGLESDGGTDFVKCWRGSVESQTLRGETNSALDGAAYPIELVMDMCSDSIVPRDSDVTFHRPLSDRQRKSDSAETRRNIRGGLSHRLPFPRLCQEFTATGS